MKRIYSNQLIVIGSPWLYHPNYPLSAYRSTRNIWYITGSVKRSDLTFDTTFRLARRNRRNIHIFIVHCPYSKIVCSNWPFPYVVYIDRPRLEWWTLNKHSTLSAWVIWDGHSISLCEIYQELGNWKCKNE